ncbi:LacI family DNA-binding transcriptional regulator [Fluviibacterium sp. DFM31]|uniref:LacI family DNA-binding transcriptional regulator n=1 Tax=Meridianimarinicoccus marinus TaxID=3231483 RepID=A0ABV3L9U4_9RHOB
MKSQRPQITLDDVATRAGVTTMTISRYFRTPEKVSPATRDKIAAAIDQLGYVADSTAARLAGKTRSLLAVITPSLALPYVPEIIEGVSEVADRADAALMLHETRFDLTLQEQRIEAAISWRPDGIIFIGDTISDRSRRQIAAAQIPFVEAWAQSDHPVGIDVGLSHSDLARDMTLRLIGAGYKTIGFAVRRMGYRVEAERLKGYQQAMTAHGRAPQVFECGDQATSFQSGAQLLTMARAATPAPDALFFAGDLLAAGALFEAQRQGLRVPQDIAICGFGDYPISREIVPSLTTVALPTRALGRRAAHLCLPQAPQPSPPEPCTSSFVERQSARLAPVP